jgi:hypothetical protein
MLSGVFEVLGCCGGVVTMPKNKKLLVEKQKFDAVLSNLLKAKPMPMKSVKTQGKHGPKSQVIPRQLES